MSSSSIWCAACGRGLLAGAALRVVPVSGAPAFAICRYSVNPMCMRAAGPSGWATIELFDVAAAAESDRGSDARQATDNSEHQLRLAARAAERGRLRHSEGSTGSLAAYLGELEG